jgi:hypothetical protein
VIDEVPEGPDVPLIYWSAPEDPPN